MNSEQSSRRRRRTRTLLVLVSVVGVAAAAIAVGDRIRLRSLRGDLADADPVVRLQALCQVARERERRLADAVLAALETEQDRAVLGAAGYAAVRIGEALGVGVLQRRADEGPDDAVHAKLILYAARLSQGDARLIDWLAAGVASGEPWRRAASAVGLLETGQTRGGEILIKMAPELAPDVRLLAMNGFRRIAEPMAQAIGRRIDWSVVQEGGIDDPRWADVRVFWERHATAELLSDVLARLERPDRRWKEVNRLLHARDRVATWFE